MEQDIVAYSGTKKTLNLASENPKRENHQLWDTQLCVDH